MGTLQVRRKRKIFPGIVLWLDEDASAADNIIYRRSGLTSGALDHPVLVVDTLRDDHEYLWVCVVSRLDRQCASN